MLNDCEKIPSVFQLNLICCDQYMKQEYIQSNTYHPLAENMGYIKFEGMWISYLDVTFTLMYELDLINTQRTNVLKYVKFDIKLERR